MSHQGAGNDFLGWLFGRQHAGGGTTSLNNVLPPGASIGLTDPNMSFAGTDARRISNTSGEVGPNDPYVEGLPNEASGSRYPRPRLDAPFENAERYTGDIYGQREEDKLTALERAITSLLGLDRGIRTEFNTRRDEVSAALPLNPYSAELANRRIQASNDAIRREIADISGVQSGNLSARGFGGSGISSGASAQLQGLGVSSRAANRNQIFDEQRIFNARQNEIRERMLNQIMGGKTDLTTRLGTLRAGLETSAFEDPTDAIENFKDFFTAQMGQRQADELIALAREQGRELDPTIYDLIGGGVNVAALIAGLPGVATGSGVIPLFGDFLQGSNNPFNQG